MGQGHPTSSSTIAYGEFTNELILRQELNRLRKKPKSMEEMYKSPLSQDSGQPAIQQSIKPESHKTREMDIDIGLSQLLQASTADQMQIRHSLEKIKCLRAIRSAIKNNALRIFDL